MTTSSDESSSPGPTRLLCVSGNFPWLSFCHPNSLRSEAFRIPTVQNNIRVTNVRIHDEPSRSLVAVSHRILPPDGTTAHCPASASVGVTVFNIGIRRPILRLTGHRSSVWGLQSAIVSPDRTLIMSGGDDCRILLYNATQGDLVGILPDPPSYCCRLLHWPSSSSSSDSDSFSTTLFAAGHHSLEGDAVLTRYDLRTQTQVSEFGGTHDTNGHEDGVWGLAADPIRNMLISSSVDRTVKFWSCETATCVSTLRFSSSVNSLCYSERYFSLLVGLYDGTLAIFDSRMIVSASGGGGSGVLLGRSAGAEDSHRPLLQLRPSEACLNELIEVVDTFSAGSGSGSGSASDSGSDSDSSSDANLGNSYCCVSDDGDVAMVRARLSSRGIGVGVGGEVLQRVRFPTEVDGVVMVSVDGLGAGVGPGVVGIDDDSHTGGEALIRMEDRISEVCGCCESCSSASVCVRLEIGSDLVLVGSKCLMQSLRHLNDDVPEEEEDLQGQSQRIKMKMMTDSSLSRIDFMGVLLGQTIVKDSQLLDLFVVFSELGMESHATAACRLVEKVEDLDMLVSLVRRMTQISTSTLLGDDIGDEDEEQGEFGPSLFLKGSILSPFGETLVRQLRKPEHQERIRDSLKLIESLGNILPYLYCADDCLSSLFVKEEEEPEPSSGTPVQTDLSALAPSYGDLFERLCLQLYEARTFPNVKLISSDGGEEMAHVEILIARSNFFYRLLKVQGGKAYSDLQAKGTITSNFSHDFLIILLRWIYLRCVNQDSTVPLLIQLAAHGEAYNETDLIEIVQKRIQVIVAEKASFSEVALILLEYGSLMPEFVKMWFVQESLLRKETLSVDDLRAILGFVDSTRRQERDHS